MCISQLGLLEGCSLKHSELLVKRDFFDLRVEQFVANENMASDSIAS